jgi:DMSO reductase anchor subunit
MMPAWSTTAYILCSGTSIGMTAYREVLNGESEIERSLVASEMVIWMLL